MNGIYGIISRIPRFKILFALFIGSILLSEGILVQAIPLLDRAVNNLIETTPEEAAEGVLVIFIILFIVRAAIQLLNRVSFTTGVILEEAAWTEIFKEGIAKLLNHDMAYLTATSSSKRLNQVNRAAGRISNLFTQAAAQFLRNITRAIGALIILLFVDWRSAVGVLTTVIIYSLIQIIRFRKDRPIAKKRDKLGDDEISKYWEIVPQPKLPKLYNREAYEVKKLSGLRDQFTQLNKKSEKLWLFADIADIFFVMSITLVVGYFAAIRAIEGDFSLATFVLVYGLIYRVQNPFWIVTWFMWTIQDVRDRSEKYLKILNSEQKINDPEQPKKIDESALTIELKQVDFVYPKKKGETKNEKVTQDKGVDEKATNAAEHVLNGISMKFKQNEFSALVGKSGAGKSTIMNLLPRFYDPNKGSVSLGGIDLREVSQAELRGLIGYVTQESQVFSGTVEENLRYAKEDATGKEMIAALKKANAWEFVKEFDKELKTKIGERGVKLSGGQKQRLAIARTILKDPKILLLDEATNALDSESEVLVQSALEDLMKDRTVIAIAHRLSTIMKADTIYVIDEGQVVESGSHEELLKHNGVYKKLHDIQSGNFEEMKELMDEYELS